ncbi:MAG TPA: MarR family winged helix-turn-helix transcriptional regulator [Solirubrobacteraceae bacterium]|nr:MarR family winged helix-turn-helix transcriptional regulator [Solirubrobacteraceae bacterium]
MTPEELAVCWQVRRTCACDQLRRVARGVTQVYDDAVLPSGLRITQLAIFVGLSTEGDLPLTVLADGLGLDRTTLTRNLKVLEDRGLIRTYQHADDARVRMVAMTLEGSRRLSAALKLWGEVQELVEARFGRDRLVALEDELAAFSRALDA